MLNTSRVFSHLSVSYPQPGGLFPGHPCRDKYPPSGRHAPSRDKIHQDIQFLLGEASYHTEEKIINCKTILLTPATVYGGKSISTLSHKLFIPVFW